MGSSTNNTPIPTIYSVSNYTGPNDTGTSTLAATEYQLPSQTGTGASPLTYNQIATSLGMAGVTGEVLALMNLAATGVASTDGAVTPQGSEVYVPAGVGAAQALTVGGGAITVAAGSSGILDLQAMSFTPITSSGTDNGAYIYVLDGSGNGIGQVSTTGANSLSVSLSTVSYPVNDSPTAAQGYANRKQIEIDANTGVYKWLANTSNNFAPPDAAGTNNYGLPYFAIDGSTTTNAASFPGAAAASPYAPGNINNTDASLAVLNSASDTPDADWNIGLDASGNVTIAGASSGNGTYAAGFTGTATLTQGQSHTTGMGQSAVTTYDPTIRTVQLDQTQYALAVPANNGTVSQPTGSYNLDIFGGTILAESAGTHSYTLNAADVYWHVNGSGDTATLNGADEEIYLPTSGAGLTPTYTPGTQGGTDSGGNYVTPVPDTLAVGGLTLNLGTGSGELNFSDGTIVGLGDMGDAIEYATLGTGQFTLDGGGAPGGNQTIYGDFNPATAQNGAITNQIAVFTAGNDVPDQSWDIYVTGSGATAQTVLDGTGAGYDGVATLSNIGEVTLADATYALDSFTGGSHAIAAPANGQAIGTIVAESSAGGNSLNFNTGIYNSYWHVAGAGDRATLTGGYTQILMADDAADYTFSQPNPNSVTLTDHGDSGTGGINGTTTIALNGGTGEIVFADGAAWGLGGITDPVEFAGPGAIALTVEDGGTAYGGTGADSFTVQGSGVAHGGTGADTFTLQGAGTAYGATGSGANNFTLNAGGTAYGGTGSGANTFTLNAGGTAIGAGSGANSFTLNAGGTATGASAGAGNSYTLAGGNATIVGAGSSNAVQFIYTPASSTTLQLGLNVTSMSGGTTVIDGTGAGYSGTATLSGVQQVSFPYAEDLLSLPQGGGATTVSTPTDGTLGTLLADAAGAQTVIFNSADNVDWHIGASGGGSDTAILNAGNAQIYLPGAYSAYNIGYDMGGNLLVSANAGGGTLHVNLAGGQSGDLIFRDGTDIGLGDAGSTQEYGGAGNDSFTVPDGPSAFNGGGGYNVAYIDTAGTKPDQTLTATQSSSGAVSIIATASDQGTISAGLTNIETVYLGPDGGTQTAYDLMPAPAAGGSMAIYTPTDGAAGTIVTDGAANDALSFSSASTSYWHVGLGNNTATLNEGLTEIYLPGAQSDYMVNGIGSNLVTVTGHSATETINLAGGSADLVYGAGAQAPTTHLTSPTATALTGGAANDTFTLSSGTNYNVNGGGGANTAILSGASAPSGLWQFSTDGAGNVFINGGAAGFGSISELALIQTLQFGSNQYALDATPSTGGSQTIGNHGYGTIVVDGQGNDALTFASTGGTNYWYTGGGNDTATLQSGNTNIYLQGSASQYTITEAQNQVTIAGPNGTKTINIGAGKGEIDFVNGSTVTPGIGLGSQSSATQTPIQVGGTGGNLFIALPTGQTTIVGGSGVNTANFTLTGSKVSQPDARWGFGENAAGQITANGAAAGYNGTALMTNIQKVVLGPTYDVAETNPAGGSLTVTTPSNGSAGTLVVDGPGNDALTFNSTSSSYWSVGGGNDAATLNAGNTAIYFHGAAAQYAFAYDGAGTLIVTDSVAGRDGVKTVKLTGGAGTLNFGDGNVYGLAGSNRSIIYAGTNTATLTGTSNNDTFYASLAPDTFVGNGSGGLDQVVVSTGTGPSGLWSFATDGAGNVTVNGANAGYNNTLVLKSIQAVRLGGLGYMLATTPAAGGTLTIGNASYGSGTIVVDGSGNDNLIFNANSVYNTGYWYAGLGNDSVTLQSGRTEMYFQGTASQYSLAYTANTLTVTGPNGTKTIHLNGGTGDIAFVNGGTVSQAIGLGQGSTPETNEYGGAAANSFVVTSGLASVIAGGSGVNTVSFVGVGNDSTPDSRWGFVENAAGQLTIANSKLGFTGSVAMTGVQKLSLGQVWDVATLPVAGGSATIGAPSSGSTGTLVTDGPGNDTLTFNSAVTNYWSTGNGSDTASLNSGNTQIAFHGTLAQYTVGFDNAGTLTITDSVAGRDGTKAITINGGIGDIRFTDNLVGLNDNGRQSVYTGTAAEAITGTAYNDIFNLGSGADTITGNGGPDHYRIGAGTTTETIVNGLATSNTAQGEIDFLGSLTENNLWFQKSGSDLVIDALGTTRQTVVKNWFAAGSTYAQVAEIVSADGFKLDAGVPALVQAMASFQASHGAFNPQATGTTMPTDPSVQSALAANWHH